MKATLFTFAFAATLAAQNFIQMSDPPAAGCPRRRGRPGSCSAPGSALPLDIAKNVAHEGCGHGGGTTGSCDWLRRRNGEDSRRSGSVPRGTDVSEDLLT